MAFSRFPYRTESAKSLLPSLKPHLFLLHYGGNLKIIYDWVRYLNSYPMGYIVLRSMNIHC